MSCQRHSFYKKRILCVLSKRTTGRKCFSKFYILHVHARSTGAFLSFYPFIQKRAEIFHFTVFIYYPSPFLAPPSHHLMNIPMVQCCLTKINNSSSYVKSQHWEANRHSFIPAILSVAPPNQNPTP